MFIHCVKTRLTLLIKEVNSRVLDGFQALYNFKTHPTKSNILV